MTPPNPSITKDPAAHAARMQLGNFFPSAATSHSSFESLLPREAPQKRKPAEDHAALAFTTPHHDPHSPKKASTTSKQEPDKGQQSSATPKQTTDTAQQSSATPKQSTDTAQNSSATPKQTADTAQQPPLTPQQDTATSKQASDPLQQPADTSKQQATPASDQTKEIARPPKDLQASKADMPKQIDPKTVDGMENAENPDDMVSLASIDDVDSGVRQTNTATPRDAAFITTAARLAASTASQRQTLSGITGASSTGDTADAALHQAATPHRTAAAKSPSAAAASLLKALPAELDKFRQSGKSSLQLDLPVGDNESVKIRLNLRGNEIRATFIADSPELREALAKAWPEFSSASRERGFRFGDPSFQDSSNQQNNRKDSDEPSTPPSFTPAPQRPAPRQPASDSTALWA